MYSIHSCELNILLSYPVSITYESYDKHMTVETLEKALKKSGFNEDQLDSGCNHIKKAGHITFICYVEPDIEVEFIIIYHWSNNEVKGTYNISLKELSKSSQPVEAFFRIAKNNIPPYIGERIDTHEEVEKAIRQIHWYTQEK